MSQTSLLPNQAMALSQLYTNAINNPLMLEVLASIPREQFAPKHLKNCAYIDEDLEIGEGRFMLAPLDQAKLIQAAQIQPSDRVLDVACCHGYSTAIISHLAAQVIGIDSSAMFKQCGEKQLKALGITNAELQVVEDITQGYEYAAPYDVIIINGQVPSVPAALRAQLSEHGKLVYVQATTKEMPGVQGFGKLLIEQEMQVKTIDECFVPALKAFHQPEGFTL